MKSRVSNTILLSALLGLLICQTASAVVPYNTEPDWLSVENSDYGTGCDFADVDGDGYLDLGVSNGNDIVLAPNYVYINQDGVLPNAATWTSADERYSGHCEFGDLNSDGYPEFMVANYISPNWTPADVQVYYNSGGVLETTPSWQPDGSFYSFRATLGDADGDGDLDLAVATGEAYNNYLEPNYIFFNDGGVLETTPSWVSVDVDASYDVQFVDIDDDGDLDLALLNGGDGYVKIYHNIQGVIQTSPGWVTDLSDNGNSFDFADVNDDGYLDLGVANNDQLGGSGYFKIYLSVQGTLNNSADWVSTSSGYGSEAIFCDLDIDGQNDFIAGRWWGRLQVFLNDAGNFATTPQWMSSPTYESVIENVAFADVDNSHVQTRVQNFTEVTNRQLFYLDHRHLQAVESVSVDGIPLELWEYCYHRKNGWVSLAVTPRDSVRVTYLHSSYPDMAVSNWDGPTYLFYNTNPVTPVPSENDVAVRIEPSFAYPNPFNAQTSIRFTLPEASRVEIVVFDLTGRRIATLLREDRPAGHHSVAWHGSGLASGVYLYRLQHSAGSETGRLTLVK